MGLYRTLLRPLLFTLPPERAQVLVGWLLRRRLPWKLLQPLLAVPDRRLAVTVAGLPLPSPVGLAAGYDKDCRFLASLADLGFGYIVGGTVTLHPRSGNPSPYLARLPRQQSLLNALGFPSAGAQAVQRNLKKLERPNVPLVISIAGLEGEEVTGCHRLLEPLADAVELNISSPNTEGLRRFHQPEELAPLLQTLNARRKKPLFIKLPPYTDPQGQAMVFSLLQTAIEHGVDGVTVANSHPVKAPQLTTGAGGLSGKAIFPHTLRMVSEVRAVVGRRMAVHACGGISSAQDAVEALRAGADTVQLLTGLIYQGPGLVRSIHRGLLRYLEEHGLASVGDLVAKADVPSSPTPPPRRE